MQRQEDRKPSPGDRLAPVDNQSFTESNGDSRKVRATSSHRAAPKSIQSEDMLAKELSLLSRGDSAPDLGLSGRAEEPADLSQLDEIWKKDLSKVSLPEYVKANATTITFPEKVRY